MIELISETRCIKCDACIRVCPTNVFEHGAERLPVIKRQDDCQTCFMCEAWCPTDALFVAPQTEAVAEDSPYRDEAWLIEQKLLGSYRRQLGWNKDAPLGPRPDPLKLMMSKPLPIGASTQGGER